MAVILRIKSLAQVLLFFVFLPLGSSVCLRRLTSLFDVVLPKWIVISLSIVILPLYATIRSICREVLQRREAAAMGARLVPRAKGKWPGNIDILIEQMARWNTGYPGKLSTEKINYNTDSSIR